MKYSYYSVKNGWEQARLIAYLIAQTNSTKKLSVTDIVRFYWEEDNEEVNDNKPITERDIERLKQMADNYLQTIKLKEDGTN